MIVRELILDQYSMILDRKIKRVRMLEADGGNAGQIGKERRDRDRLASAIQSGVLLPGFTTKYRDVIEEEVVTWVNSMLYVRNHGALSALYIKTSSGEYVYSYSVNRLAKAPFPYKDLTSEAFLDKGMVHIYYGDGEGVVTAAFGLAYRVMGYGCKVVAAQFLKGRDTGEARISAVMDDIMVFKGMETEKFTFEMTRQEIENITDYSLAVFKNVVRLSQDPEIRLLVLDSILDACATEVLPMDTLTDFLARKRAGLEIVLTGTILPGGVKHYGDYISHVKKERHPFDRGIIARQGIDY